MSLERVHFIRVTDFKLQRKRTELTDHDKRVFKRRQNTTSRGRFGPDVIASGEKRLGGAAITMANSKKSTYLQRQSLEIIY